jgi:hypothetical protein
VRNPKAVVAFLFGVLALLFLAAGVALPRFRDDVEPLEALVVVPAGFVAGLIAIALARRARFDFQRTLGRAGGDGLAVTARVLGIVAVLISLTAGLAVGVYAVLILVQG